MGYVVCYFIGVYGLLGGSIGALLEDRALCANTIFNDPGVWIVVWPLAPLILPCLWFLRFRRRTLLDSDNY
jgi:hypothetical protein